MAISDYMHYKYVRDARGENGEIDCWGLVRVIWEKEFGKAPLPMFGGTLNPRDQTRRYTELSDHGIKDCDIKSGAIAACFQSKLCTHVGIVIECDGQLKIMDIQEGSPVSIHDVRKFVSKFSKVTFHDY